MITFTYEYYATQEEVRKHIQECESHHTQQAKKYKLGMNPNSRNGFKKGNTFGSLNKGKARLDFRGEGNPRWNGGRGTTSQGYIEILSEGNHSKNKRGRILEHRFVMEEYLGRKLSKSEVVHHINKNRQDNRIENLRLFVGGHKEHLKEHHPGEDTKKKISNALRGREFSSEHRKNLSLALMGNKNGRKHE